MAGNATRADCTTNRNNHDRADYTDNRFNRDRDGGDNRDRDDRYEAEWLPRRKGNREQRRTGPPRREGRSTARPLPSSRRGPTRAARTGTEAFKCRHCRAFVGATVMGGRHRNHCPLCLHSRHVDGVRPGDRAGTCGSTMAPVARFDRPGGEPVLVHRCLGCGFERHNRLAADDNITLLTRLPLVAPRLGRRTSAGADAEGRQVS